MCIYRKKRSYILCLWVWTRGAIEVKITWVVVFSWLDYYNGFFVITSISWWSILSILYIWFSLICRMCVCVKMWSGGGENNVSCSEKKAENSTCVYRDKLGSYIVFVSVNTWNNGSENHMNYGFFWLDYYSGFFIVTSVLWWSILSILYTRFLFICHIYLSVKTWNNGSEIR